MVASDPGSQFDVASDTKEPTLESKPHEDTDQSENLDRTAATPDAVPEVGQDKDQELEVTSSPNLVDSATGDASSAQTVPETRDQDVTRVPGSQQDADNVVTAAPLEPVTQVESGLDVDREGKVISGDLSNVSEAVGTSDTNQLLEAVVSKPEDQGNTGSDPAVASDSAEAEDERPATSDQDSGAGVVQDAGGDGAASAGTSDADLKQNDTENSTSILNDSIIDGKEVSVVDGVG